jgi:hypothetical protein
MAEYLPIVHAQFSMAMLDKGCTPHVSFKDGWFMINSDFVLNTWSEIDIRIDGVLF